MSPEPVMKLRKPVIIFLTHRYLPFFLGMIGMLLALPSLWVGWQLDDLYIAVFY